MTVINEGRHTAEYLVSEANGTRSRDVVTLAAGHKVAPGDVLAKVTATGKYVPLDPAGADGSEAAIAIAFDHVDATTAEKPAVITARDSEVRASALGWPAGISGADRAEGLAALAGVGIIAR